MVQANQNPLGFDMKNKKESQLRGGASSTKTTSSDPAVASNSPLQHRSKADTVLSEQHGCHRQFSFSLGSPGDL
jgi:hypothetical protein